MATTRARLIFGLLCLTTILFILVVSWKRTEYELIRDIHDGEIVADDTEDDQFIFFLECSKTFQFTSVQWCAIESAASHYPEKTIVVIFFFYNMFPVSYLSKSLFEKHSNIKFAWWSNLTDLMSHTPFATLESNNVIESSRYRENNYSNLLRIFFVYTYGGTYYDIDYVTVKRIPSNMSTNFVVGHDADEVNNSVLRFKTKHHEFLRMYMDEAVSCNWLLAIGTYVAKYRIPFNRVF